MKQIKKKQLIEEEFIDTKRKGIIHLVHRQTCPQNCQFLSPCLTAIDDNCDNCGFQCLGNREISNSTISRNAFGLFLVVLEHH